MNRELTTAPLTEVGTLLVRVSTAGIFIPVEGADIRISGAREENRYVQYFLTSDRSGLAEKITLPTLATYLSLTPGNPRGYADYNIEVYKNGFYPAVYQNVPLFPGITSVQAVELIPMPPYRPEEYPPRSEILIEEGEPPLYEEVG